MHPVYLHGILAGFGACMYSQIQLLTLAPGFSNILVSRSLSTGHRHLSMIADDLQRFPLTKFESFAWLSKTMSVLAEKFGSQFGTRCLLGFSSSRGFKSSVLFRIIDALLKSDQNVDVTSPSEIQMPCDPVHLEQQDVHSEFFQHRHGCMCHAHREEPHTSRKYLPRIPRLQDLQKAVLSIAESKFNQKSKLTGFSDKRRHSVQGAEWETLELQPCDISAAMFNVDTPSQEYGLCLVGWLEGCPLTGHLMLTDASGSIDCVSTCEYDSLETITYIQGCCSR